MKLGNVVLALVLILLCAGGWIVLVLNSTAEVDMYEVYMDQGDDWVKDGLYQRAIGQYRLALQEKITEDAYEKIYKAYLKRYEEAPEDTLEEFIGFLQEAVNVYPANKKMVDSLVEYYTVKKEYALIYNCLSKAIANGYNDKDVKEKLLDARYAYKVQEDVYTTIHQSIGTMYSIEIDGEWNLYGANFRNRLTYNYIYVGLGNAAGDVVVTGEEDSRLIAGDGMVLGIFKEKVVEAGVYSEGLVPARCDEEYAYYDEFAQKKFGGYQMAGMFQNGKAAVQKEDKWMLIDAQGEKASELYEEIVLDYCGRYLVNDTIMVKKSDKTYQLYNEQWELKAELKCEDADIFTEDGLIAVCKDGKWGFVNTSGETVIKAKYSDARSFSNGLAAVCEDGKWGFIDPDGNLVIECQFADVGYMGTNGACPVRTVTQENDAVAEGSEAISPDDAENADENVDDKSEQEETETIAPISEWKILQLIIGIVGD